MAIDMTMDVVVLDSLIPKIAEIKGKGKIPVIFILIGSYPGYSRFHQTPPIIEEYVKNPKLAPIVVLIDQAYKKTHWLSFFDDEYMKYLKSDNDEISQPDVKPGVWYYPGLITNLGNDKILDYHHQVPYQYYPNMITEGELYKIATNDIISDNLTLIWAFNNWTFNCGPVKLNNRNFHIPDSHCMADVENNINYFPVISRDINGYYFRTRYNTIEDILPILKKETDLKNKKRLKGFIYNIFSKWLEYYSSIRRWEIFVRFNDPSLKITVGKDSTDDEWCHLHRRAGFGLTIQLNTIKEKFMISPHQYFYQYINEEIYKMGCVLIQYDCILQNDESALSVQIELFNQEHTYMITNNSSDMPQLLKFFEKRQDYVN